MSFKTIQNYVSKYYNRKRTISPTNGGTPPFKDLGTVIQAPLDQKRYKVIELQNGMKACLVSTCMHEKSLTDDTELFKSCLSSESDKVKVVNNDAIKQFDQTHIFKWTQGTNSAAAGVQEINPPPVAEKTLDSNCPSPTSSAAPARKAPKLMKCSNGPATICVSVGAGSFHDPNAANGLAHLVEHAIFLGSKQYPQPNGLFAKVFENGGVVNATTNPEHTDFYFSCAYSAFDECVAILVDALINPLLKDADIRREINALDSEYRIKQTDDILRINDFLRSQAKTGHPFRKFYWGRQASLDKPGIGDQVRQWKKRYYCANYITVCIQAPMSLEKLEAFAMKHFSDFPSSLPNSKLPSDELLAHKEPYAKDKFEMCYFVAPLTHLTCLVITWTLSAKFWQAYETKPLEYIRFLVESTSRGGLKRYLRWKQWMSEWNNLTVNCCSTDDFCRNIFCSFFGITIDLTDKGYKECEMVLQAVFSYLKMLSRGGVRPDIFKEMQSNVANKFHLSNWDEMLQKGMDIAADLHYVPPTHILTAKTLMTNWDPDLIQEALDSLTPASANFTFVSRENIDICKQSAWPSGIRYADGKFKPQVYKQLETTKVMSEFSLPPDGTFQPKNISVGPHDTGSMSLGTIHKTDKLKVVYVSENKVPYLTPLVPSAAYSVFFSSPTMMGRTSRMKLAVLEYWFRLLINQITEETAHKFDHLFTYEMDFGDDGIEMHLMGPSCHLVELLTLIMRQMFGTCGVDDNTDGGRQVAENLKLDLLREYRNTTYDVETLSRDIMHYLQDETQPCFYELIKQLDDVSLGGGDFFQLINAFRKRMMVCVEIHGSITTGDAHQIVQLFTGESEKCVQYSKPPVMPKSIVRGTLLPLGTSLLAIKASHPAYITSIISNFFQVDHWKGKGGAEFVIILYYLMRRRIADQLRTKEQLGYTVRLTPVHHLWGDCTLGIRITVFSHPTNHTVLDVNSRIEHFVQEFYQKTLRGDTQARAYIKKHWFKENEEERFVELERFYRDNLLKDGYNFRKLIVLLEGYQSKTQLSKKKQDKLTAEGLPKDGNDDATDGDAADEGYSCIKLKYLQFDDKEKKKFKKQGIQIIDSVESFKRRLALLPVHE